MADVERDAVTTRLADLRETADRERVIALLDMYAREPMGQGRPLDGDVRRRLDRDLARIPHLFAVLAESSGKPVGIAMCVVGYSTFLGRPLVNIHDLAVDPELRGQGVGAALIQAAEREAVQRGCGRLTLEVRSDNHPAKKLYQRLGFSSREGSSVTEFWTKPLHSSPSATKEAS